MYTLYNLLIYLGFFFGSQGGGVDVNMELILHAPLMGCCSHGRFVLWC